MELCESWLEYVDSWRFLFGIILSLGGDGFNSWIADFVSNSGINTENPEDAIFHWTPTEWFSAFLIDEYKLKIGTKGREKLRRSLYSALGQETLVKLRENASGDAIVFGHTIKVWFQRGAALERLEEIRSQFKAL